MGAPCWWPLTRRPTPVCCATLPPFTLQVEASFRGAATSLSTELQTWVKDEALWSRTWARLLEQLEGI